MEASQNKAYDELVAKHRLLQEDYDQMHKLFLEKVDRLEQEIERLRTPGLGHTAAQLERAVDRLARLPQGKR